MTSKSRARFSGDAVVPSANQPQPRPVEKMVCSSKNIMKRSIGRSEVLLGCLVGR